MSVFEELIWGEPGAISVLAAVGLAVAMGISALAVEFGYALLQRSDNQRIADLAAYGGALVYNSTKSAAAATNAAQNIAALNGGTSSPPVSVTGNQVQVTVTTNLSMYLAQVLMGSTTLSVTATASAEIKSGTPPVALVQ
ncbi:MAG: hypothetical protein JOZ11_14435 [Alphaproteobacteria bacterium]|nr:hypothetical protein [Alphaproteobacteria bacterium]